MPPNKPVCTDISMGKPVGDHTQVLGESRSPERAQSPERYSRASYNDDGEPEPRRLHHLEGYMANPE